MPDRINKTVLFGILGIVIGLGFMRNAVHSHDAVWLRIVFFLVGVVIGIIGNSFVNQGINEEVNSAIREYELKRHSK